MQNAETSAANAKLPFKLWSVQISNPGYENVTNFSNPVYTDAACYPDAKAYDDVTITVYKATVTEDGRRLTSIAPNPSPTAMTSRRRATMSWSWMTSTPRAARSWSLPRTTALTSPSSGTRALTTARPGAPSA